MAARPPSAHVVLIGIDAGDWLTIDPLVQKGVLPSFARLKMSGRTGVMLSTPPLVSPIIWTTIATGMPPDKHGVLDFVVDTASGGQEPVRSVDRREPALWSLFSAQDRTVDVIGWWATWPAEHVRGTIVSDRLAPQLLQRGALDDERVIWPRDAVGRIRSLVTRPEQMGYDDLAGYIPIDRSEYARAHALLTRDGADIYADKVAHLATIAASTRTYAALAVDAIRTDRPDLLAVYVEAVDSVSHLFVRDPSRGPPAIERAYRDADELIARVAGASPPDTLIIVCSDHGFYSRTAGIAEDPSDLAGAATAWHRPYGIVAAALAGTLASRAPTESLGAADAGTVTPLDIAPTVLHAAGLAITRDMTGRVATTLLPEAAAARAVKRATAPLVPATPLPPGDGRGTGQALARLQALGYVSSARTSLARQNLAEILYRRGDLSGAERQARAVVQLQPTNLTAMLWLAKALAGQSRQAEALPVYEAALNLADGPRHALVEAVDLALGLGAPDRARALIARAERSTGAGPACAIAAGDVEGAAGAPQFAERHYRQALKQDPNSFDALARLIERLIAAGRSSEAVKMAESSAALLPDSPQHLALLGETRLAAGDPAAAERALIRALQLAPDGALIRITLGRALLMQRKSAAAVDALVPAAPSGGRDALLGAAYAAQGDWNGAAAAFQRALDEGVATPELLNGLGWAHMKLGHRELASAALKRSLVQKPNQPEIRKLLIGLQRAD